MLTGCSYGNAGYICPSHFVPMATPGIVKQGLKWMLNSSSPFYIEPRLNTSLMDWGLKFVRSANQKHVERSAVPLRNISLLSKNLYEQWAADPSFNFSYTNAGMLEMFQTPPMPNMLVIALNRRKNLDWKHTCLIKKKLKPWSLLLI
jgi:D-amino-acid dehydrogenase